MKLLKKLKKKNNLVFLDLGSQPLANVYIKKKNLKKKETKYQLIVSFNKNNKIVSIKKKFSSKHMFNKNYPYRSSMSKTMQDSFKKLSIDIKKKIKPKKILEIGCNDGAFLKNFDKNKVIGVEPCKNIAKLAKRKKLKVFSEYWNKKLARKILNKYGEVDLIYSANTISHIEDLNEVFNSINIILKKNGIFIIEDPSLLECLKLNSYDQFYNEHIYVFSYLSLKNILKKYNLEIFKIENIKTHGGSNRYYIKKNENNKKIEKSVNKEKNKETKYGLNNHVTYKKFSERVKKSKKKLISIFKKCKKTKKKIIGYGATAKSTTVLNYCNINNFFINYFLDTTPEKQGKYTPGTKIHIKRYKGYIEDDVKYIFLGAWNFKKEIFKKEKKFIDKGGKFITHVPYPRIV